MLDKHQLINQKGFTLIEVIAVLVLLGILSAYAVPKFFSMQEQTETETLRIVLNDLKSRAVLGHSRSMLANGGIADPDDSDTFLELGLTYTADTLHISEDLVQGQIQHL